MSSTRSTPLLLISIVLGGLLIVFCKKQQRKGLSFDPLQAHLVSYDSLPTELFGPSVFQLDGYFVWGGSVVKGDDDRYHMFFSLWESGEEEPVFSDAWLLKSKIGYATSDYPDRDFEFQKIILRPHAELGLDTAWDALSVHNPHIKRFGDKYYLYYTGTRDPGEDPNDKGRHGLNKRNRAQQSQCIGVIEFSDFSDLVEGRFVRPQKALLKPRTRVKDTLVVNGSPPGTVAKPDNLIVVNPSVVFNPEKNKYHLYFKGNIYEPHWKGVHGVAISDSPLGPFKALDTAVFDARMPDGTYASCEDPYVWYSPIDEKFHAVVKDFSGELSGEKYGLARVESLDGISWELPENPLFMSRTLYLKNGDSLSVDRLERPQILLSPTGIPQVVYLACARKSLVDKRDGSSCNVHIGIESW